MRGGPHAITEVARYYYSHSFFISMEFASLLITDTHFVLLQDARILSRGPVWVRGWRQQPLQVRLVFCLSFFLSKFDLSVLYIIVIIGLWIVVLSFLSKYKYVEWKNLRDHSSN